MPVYADPKRSPFKEFSDTKGTFRFEIGILMTRQTFDKPDIQLAEEEAKWLRLRREAQGITLTYKHFNGQKTVGSVDEVEIQVDDFAKTSELLQRIGCLYPVITKKATEKSGK